MTAKHLMTPKERHAYHYMKKRIKMGFYNTREWKSVRYAALLRYGKKCMCCGSTYRIQVDHIKPVSKFPLLALDLNNVQILCKDCNSGKSNLDMTDFR